MPEVLLSTAQLVPLGIFCFLMAFFGILGNGIVLYSSFRYNAIKLDKVSLIFVRNLAFADILYSLFAVLPNFVTYATRRWVLGDAYCWVSAQLSLIPGMVNSLLVMVITLYRLILLYSPFTVTRCLYARIVAGALWIFSLSPTIVSLSYRSRSIFDAENGVCLSEIYTKDDAGVAEVVLSFVGACVLLPILVILVANMALSWKAVKLVSTGSRNKSLVMTCCLAGTFLVSWAPYVTYNVLERAGGEVSQGLYITSFTFIFINTAANPFLYTLTNRRFSRYVGNLLQLKIGGMRVVYRRHTTGSSSTSN